MKRKKYPPPLILHYNYDYLIDSTLGLKRRKKIVKSEKKCPPPPLLHSNF